MIRSGLMVSALLCTTAMAEPTEMTLADYAAIENAAMRARDGGKRMPKFENAGVRDVGRCRTTHEGNGCRPGGA